MEKYTQRSCYFVLEWFKGMKTIILDNQFVKEITDMISFEDIPNTDTKTMSKPEDASTTDTDMDESDDDDGEASDLYFVKGHQIFKREDDKLVNFVDFDNTPTINMKYIH